MSEHKILGKFAGNADDLRMRSERVRTAIKEGYPLTGFASAHALTVRTGMDMADFTQIRESQPWVKESPTTAVAIEGLLAIQDWSKAIWEAEKTIEWLSKLTEEDLKCGS
jgi:hypothetical protein